jgi:ATP-dependent DNA helicase RecG
MNFDTLNIDEHYRDRILNLEESQFYDLKAKEVKPAKLTKTISAFANSDGGELFIGVLEQPDDRLQRSWSGFENIEEANGHIQALTETFSLSQYYSYEFLEFSSENGWLLHISVNKTKDVSYASDGLPYERRGAQNIPVKTHEKLKRLEYNKGIISFEQQTLNFGSEIITQSETVDKFLKDSKLNTRAEVWLRKQQMLIENKPTVAGVLLFSDIPQAILPKQCGIKLYRYISKEKEGTRPKLAFDPITIEGNVYSQIYESVNKTKEIIENIRVLGEEKLDYVSYPKEALHEILTNAVIHRDYSIQTDIHIKIFDNRIEIESPGRLPAHITVQNILKEQFSRNGALVRLINKFPNPPNKDIGEGLNTAFFAMRKLRLKDPEIFEGQNSVKVVLKHETLGSSEEIVMSYLKHHLSINNRTARELTGITSENSMKQVFKRLQKRRLIEITPRTKGSATTWRLVRNAGKQLELQL